MRVNCFLAIVLRGERKEKGELKDENCNNQGHLEKKIERIHSHMMLDIKIVVSAKERHQNYFYIHNKICKYGKVLIFSFMYQMSGLKFSTFLV
jgi:hypothetical protein